MFPGEENDEQCAEREEERSLLPPWPESENLTKDELREQDAEEQWPGTHGRAVGAHCEEDDRCAVDPIGLKAARAAQAVAKGETGSDPKNRPFVPQCESDEYGEDESGPTGFDLG